jgi:hypothetical protein
MEGNAVQAANDNRPRLLTRAQAAVYCGLCVRSFSAVCTVRPIAFCDGKRWERFDVRDLDVWIDGYKSGQGGISHADALLAAM